MFVPSGDLYQRMLVEYAGIWFVPSASNEAVAVVLKARSNTLKAITQGCKVMIHFGIDDTSQGRVLVSALQVFDQVESPSMVTNPHHERVEQEILTKILQRGRAPLFLFDELNRNVAWADCDFGNQRQGALNLIGIPSDLYAGDFNRLVSQAMDKLDNSFKPRSQSYDAIEIPTAPIVLNLSKLVVAELYGISLNDGVQQFSIADADEGGGLEQSTWQLIDDFFLGNTFRSPQVTSGNKRRELTDVLALTDKGAFLFESKALGVFSTSPAQSTTRRARSLEGRILKAIGQLVGAVKSLRNGEQVFSGDGMPVEIDRTIPPHGIVLLSEMYPFGDWPMISRHLINSSQQSAAMLHILDLNELLIMVASSPTPDHLDYFFMKRFERLIDTENALFRMRFQPRRSA